jgi:hypothetical protein
MGLKSGSRNSGLDDSQESSNQDNEEEPADVEANQGENAEHPSDRSDDSKTDIEAESKPERPTKESLPYKLRREKVNAGREQVPFFLRKEVVNAEGDLQDTLEELLDENVYKSDYREAAMIVAQRNPELVAEVLREWGYDLDTV